MKILITGKGSKAGSWKIRGEQLGAALGATVRPVASEADCRKADIIIAVKKTPMRTIENIRRSGRPWVWDIVDAWPQPCDWGIAESVSWLRGEIDKRKPNAVVYGTEQLLVDADYPRPNIVLPHHSFPKYVDREPQINERVAVVGYQGEESYLGRWRPMVEAACKRRGWQFVVNGDMTQADIGIALRDRGGYPARCWKPGTKLSNLHALGIPALCNPEAGYESVACGTEHWIKSEQDIADAFDRFESFGVRVEACEMGRAAMIPLDSVAARYREWLESL